MSLNSVRKGWIALSGLGVKCCIQWGRFGILGFCLGLRDVGSMEGSVLPPFHVNEDHLPVHYDEKGVVLQGKTCSTRQILKSCKAKLEILPEGLKVGFGKRCMGLPAKAAPPTYWLWNKQNIMNGLFITIKKHFKNHQTFSITFGLNVIQACHKVSKVMCK